MDQQTKDSEAISRRYLVPLTIGALGVVYGDIGTSPLYALRECFVKSNIALEQSSVLGILSLMIWALVVIISIKYVGFIMRANNRGEGGTLALMALANRASSADSRSKMIVFAGLLGASFLFGDSIITPAISVLSAVEGLELVTPIFAHSVVPITLVILALLFLMQSQGTGKIGKIFGPVILLWFLTLGILGVSGILLNPIVLKAFSPWFAISFLATHHWEGFLTLGGVFLTVTGGEALYADMGHFGRIPIQIGWYAVALPGLVLNYLGQGALLLAHPETLNNPFYLLAPEWARIPLVILATLATVIASQAVITGAFSLTRQAVNLGYLPRMKILHTSATEIGQIYVPLINSCLLVSTIVLVESFRTSSNLASAYGIAVSFNMVITTLLAFFVARDQWLVKKWILYPCIGSLLAIEFSFLSANLLKVSDGGWVPLGIAMTCLFIFTTWARGRKLVNDNMKQGLLPMEAFVGSLSDSPALRVPGTAVFLSRNVNYASPAMLHHLDLNKALHEQVVILQVVTEEVPLVPTYSRVQVERLGRGFLRVIAHYGFQESPNVPEILRICEDLGFEIDRSDITFFVGKETIIPTDRPGMALWRENVFAFMSRNAQDPSTFFGLPRDRVIELGLQVEI